MATANPLGEYLRARRELTDPAAAGLRPMGARRTPGLRREEVATLAGISADYYLRLEQGRDRNPSRQVLDALARVFDLDATARDYLLSLTSPPPTRASRRHRAEKVPAGILALVTSLELPAFVEDKRFDIIAANRHAIALTPSLRPGENRMRSMFLDPDEQDRFPDWEQSLPTMVASLRTSLGTDVGDPRATQLVGELSLASERFRRLWARHDVKPLAGAGFRLRHPLVGMLQLQREKLPIPDTDGQLLAIYHAAPGSASAEALARLAHAQPDDGSRSAAEGVAVSR